MTPTQDPLLRRAHGFFALALAVIVMSALLAGIPLVAYLALLSSLTLFALAYVNYFRAPSLKGERWRPAAALVLSLMGTALTIAAFVAVPDTLEAKNASGLVEAVKRHYMVTAGTLSLTTLGWFLLGTAGDAGPRIKGLLLAALIIAVVNGLLALTYIAPNVEAGMRERFESPEGLAAFNASADRNVTNAFYQNATKDAFDPYGTLRDLGDMLPRLLGVGAFYLLWDRERRRPVKGSDGFPVEDVLKPQG